MRIVFFGTPDFAIPALDALASSHEVVLVVAQPDRPSGRGMKLHAPAVVTRAHELGLSVAQPSRVRDEHFLASVEALRPDLGVVIAYGKILPLALLAIPRLGFINVHASILPKYRGAAPIQRAIENGEVVTGVTIMRVDAELDHGPMLAVSSIDIGQDEHSPALAARLSKLGAEALMPVCAQLESGTVVEREQDHDNATLAPKIDKQEGLVRWDLPASVILNRFRAFDPWPGAFTNSFKITGLKHGDGSGGPGIIVSIDDRGVAVGTASGAILLTELQRPGRGRLPAAELARISGWREGDSIEGETS